MLLGPFWRGFSQLELGLCVQWDRLWNDENHSLETKEYSKELYETAKSKDNCSTFSGVACSFLELSRSPLFVHKKCHLDVSPNTESAVRDIQKTAETLLQRLFNFSATLDVYRLTFWLESVGPQHHQHLVTLGLKQPLQRTKQHQKHSPATPKQLWKDLTIHRGLWDVHRSILSLHGNSGFFYDL